MTALPFTLAVAVAALPLPGAAQGLGLAGYTANIEARPVAGLSRNLSGLTYSDATGTLFAVVNRPAALAELSPEGQLLRHIPLPPGWDAEGVAHIEGELFIIADEAGNHLHWIQVPARGKPIPQQTLTLRPGWGGWPNRGFEGVEWDSVRAQLLVANEKSPRKVLLIDGPGPAGVPPEITVRDWWPVQGAEAIGTDIASLASEPESGNLLLLSEESARITEYTRAGALVGVLALRAGVAGLARDVPNPEGMAIGPDGVLYLVSEPNLFYRFTPEGPAP